MITRTGVTESPGKKHADGLFQSNRSNLTEAETEEVVIGLFRSAGRARLLTYTGNSGIPAGKKVIRSISWNSILKWLLQNLRQNKATVAPRN
jgi:hypothetical protein